MNYGKVAGVTDPDKSLGMFNLARFYSISSLAIIFAAAVLITLLYRFVTIQWMDDVVDQEHLLLAQTVLNSVKPGLWSHLDGVAHDAAPLQAEFGAIVDNPVLDDTMHRINIYDHRGVRAFSSHSHLTATTSDANPALAAAIDGHASSHMVYRDMFNRWLGTSPDDNLMKTFVPIRRTAAAPVLGVLELQTDMSPLIRKNEQMFLIILLGSESVFALMYGLLILVVRRAKTIIETQQQDIQDRTAKLELLSRQLLDSDEQHKKRIAFDLHEGLAQTLAAIKFNAESNSHNFGTSVLSLDTLVPVLQDAIHEVRNIATELRPPSLDDFGLLATINGFCREFERQNPDIRVEQEHSVQGDRVPEPLKIVIYRIIKSTFTSIALGTNTDRIRVAVQLSDDTVSLTISDIPSGSYAVASITQQEYEPEIRFAEMHDRTLLSQGEFTVKRSKASGVTLRSSWSY